MVLRMKKRILLMMTVFLIFMTSSVFADSLKIGVPGYKNSYTVKMACRALKKLGAVPIKITRRDYNVDTLDGLFLPGGPDIDPKRYADVFRGAVGVRRKLDRLQFTVLDKFVRSGKPVFGTCRGLQLINVYFGGTLNQDIKGHRNVRHKVRNIKGSWCYSVLGKKTVTNSEHHQSVKKLGAGLVVCARKGKTIEALKHRSLPIYATQWHPEYRPYKPGKKVLRYWLNICQMYKNNRVN